VRFLRLKTAPFLPHFCATSRYGLRWQSAAATPLFMRRPAVAGGVALQSRTCGSEASRLGHRNPGSLALTSTKVSPPGASSLPPHLGFIPELRGIAGDKAERQRRSTFQPRVAPQALPWVSGVRDINPEGVASSWPRTGDPGGDPTLAGLFVSSVPPRVARSRNPGLVDWNALGVPRNSVKNLI